MNGIVVGHQVVKKAAFGLKGVLGGRAVLKAEVTVRTDVNVQLIVEIRIRPAHVGISESENAGSAEHKYAGPMREHFAIDYIVFEKKRAA